MKRFVRLVILFAAVSALSWTRGEEEDGVPAGKTAAGLHDVQLLVCGNSDDGQERPDFPALNVSGNEISAARTVAQQSRVRCPSEENSGGGQRLPRGGFCRNGRIVCLARPCHFLSGSIPVPLSGAVSGLFSAVSLRKLRI